MIDEPVDEQSESVEQLRRELLYTFGDYHSSIQVQVALVDRLIAATRREERRGTEGDQRGTGSGGAESGAPLIR